MKDTENIIDLNGMTDENKDKAKTAIGVFRNRLVV